MEAFPDFLPAPVYQGYGIEPADGTLRTDMEAGPARMRRRSAAPPETYRVVWQLTDADLAVLRAWIARRISGGTAWFQIELADGQDGLALREARFLGPIQPKPQSGLWWEVSANLEVRHDANRGLTTEELDAVLAYGSADILWADQTLAAWGLA